jgi:hypothetical protein
LLKKELAFIYINDEDKENTSFIDAMNIARVAYIKAIVNK